MDLEVKTTLTLLYVRCLRYTVVFRTYLEVLRVVGTLYLNYLT